ncbi:hypothetical protein AHAS_Ahas10G0209000 [Arachis hypogaea]
MSQVCSFFSKSVNPILFRAKLARKIENIQKEFNNVAKEMSKLNLNRSSVILKQDECGWRETSSSVLESEIIGREENKSDIVKLLKQTHPNQNVSLIVVVVGMGGLGKTALAQLVYNAAKDQNLFQKYIWVCVSENFEVKTVLKKILESLKKDAGGDSLEALQQKLREALNGQNYMLVLDDVWNEDHLKWSDLRSNYFQKKYQRWIKRNVAGIELLDLLLVWNTSDVITSLNLVGAPFQSLQYLPRKKKVGDYVIWVVAIRDATW